MLTATLTDLICRTMPTAAVDSGFMSQIDQTATVDAICRKYAAPEHLGLSGLTQWLADRGEKLSVQTVRAIRLRWLDEALVEGSR